MNQNFFNEHNVQSCRFAAAILLACAIVGCNSPTSTTTNSKETTASEEQDSPPSEKKIGVLLVSHGSHSKNWRKMVTDIESIVRDDVLKNDCVDGIKSAFMEYSEPSIATQLKEFDEQGYTDVIVVPLLLTVSSHSFDDIPTICGQKQDHKTKATLRLEGIDIYKPKAMVHFAPLLDFPSILGKNVTRRVRQMSKTPASEGVVMVAYGSEPYEDEWKELLDKVAAEVKAETGVDCAEYCWCGHIVRYKTEATEKAIRKVLEQKKSALVVPVLVAVSENFQGKIIGGAINNMKEKERIVYRRDAILPDENINRWVIDISRKTAEKLMNQTGTRNADPE